MKSTIIKLTLATIVMLLVISHAFGVDDPNSTSDKQQNNTESEDAILDTMGIISPEKYCELYATNPGILGFDKMHQRMIAGNLTISETPLDRIIDAINGDKLLTDWGSKQAGKIGRSCAGYTPPDYCGALEKKLGVSITIHGSDEADQFFRIYKRAIYRQCGTQLLASLGPTVFGKEATKNYNGSQSKLTECLAKPAFKVKEVLDDGSIKITENPVDCSNEKNAIENIWVQESKLSRVMAFKNGDKLFQNTSTEALIKVEPSITAMINEEKAAREQSKAAEVAAVARVKEMKTSGDFSKAVDCNEVAVATNISGLSMLRADVSPTNRYYMGTALLDQINGNNGYLKDGTGQFASITFSPKTAWIQKERIRIGNSVVFIGKYVANNQITLTSGARITAPSYEVACMMPAELLLMKK